MSDIHALSGAYAVDALDDAERTQFEQHLSVCPECRAEVASFRETAALMADLEAGEDPPASLRASVLAGISQVRPFPPETPEAPEVASTAHRTSVVTLRRRMLPTLVAAAAVVLLALGTFAWHPWHQDRTSLADQVLHAPDAVQVTEKLPGGNGELTLVRSASLKRAVLVGSHVPAPAPGTTYQMWLQQPGKGMVSAGLMPDAEEPTLLTGDAATAQAAAVSVEPETGSAQPTTDPIALFTLTAASGGNGAA
jgi:anti-sigma-K factor RskA